MEILKNRVAPVCARIKTGIIGLQGSKKERDIERMIMKFAIRNARYRMGVGLKKMRRYQILKAKHAKKLSYLGCHRWQQPKHENRLFNWSSRLFNSNERSVLELGPDFIPTTKVTDIDIICNTEAMIKRVDDDMFCDIVY
ncbi:hypothetical protein ACOME3_007217 [Neoechinorhynchus agilis]